jgi:hypothetical protein
MPTIRIKATEKAADALLALFAYSQKAIAHTTLSKAKRYVLSFIPKNLLFISHLNY